MDQQQIIAALEGRAKRLRLPMSEICKRAGIHPTTFSRWKVSDQNLRPINANLGSLSKIEAAISAAEAHHAAA